MRSLDSFLSVGASSESSPLSSPRAGLAASPRAHVTRSHNLGELRSLQSHRSACTRCHCRGRHSFHSPLESSYVVVDHGCNGTPCVCERYSHTLCNSIPQGCGPLLQAQGTRVAGSGTHTCNTGKPLSHRLARCGAVSNITKNTRHKSLTQVFHFAGSPPPEATNPPALAAPDSSPETVISLVRYTTSEQTKRLHIDSVDADYGNSQSGIAEC
jgi:hypothetical protein